MKRIYKEIHVEPLFFWVFASICALFTASFFVPFMFYVAQVVLLLIFIVAVLDGLLLFTKKEPVAINRICPKMMSLGDENKIRLTIQQKYPYAVKLLLIDELPYQLQKRDFGIQMELKNQKIEKQTYIVTPTQRGEYTFGNINAHLRTPLGLLSRHIILDKQQMVPVYPSVVQMKKYELKAFTSTTPQGVKKIRRIGHSYEFEQIKNYVRGDDTRSINWKASGRRGELMVNQYEDERSQQIYTIIDRSRSMRMPFNGMTLLDYAINTSLVMSNLVLRKHDKAGLMSFADKIGSVIVAERGNRQLHSILQSLYNEKESDTEANYELLYNATRNLIKGRSLLFLYTNFESLYSLQRVLPLLRKLNRFHLLVVMFFENTELTEFSQEDCSDIKGIYHQTIARKMVYEKDYIMQELHRHGIQAIKTKPETLSIDSINKYLELKSRGMI